MQNLDQSIAITDTEKVSNHNSADITTGIDNLRRTLEHLITGYPFTQVAATLAKVCHAQANHIRSTTVDEHLAQAWEFNARQCERVAKAAYPTQPTITLRSIKIGIEPGELQRRINTLPEPLRVIAMDYFYGALPQTGRSTAMRSILREITDRLKAVPDAGEDEIEARRRAA
jgi:hypothetical protein